MDSIIYYISWRSVNDARSAHSTYLLEYLVCVRVRLLVRLSACMYIIILYKYRVSQKTWEFSDEFDIVFMNNSLI